MSVRLPKQERVTPVKPVKLWPGGVTSLGVGGRPRIPSGNNFVLANRWALGDSGALASAKSRFRRRNQRTDTIAGPISL